MAASYTTRGRKVNYKLLSNPWPQIPRLRRQKVEDKLYPVEVTERALNRVKIHYIGYGSDDDEWRDADDIVDLTQPRFLTTVPGFSLYGQLASKIKNSLKSSRKSNPEVRIDIEFDKDLFDREMRRLGKFKQKYGGNDMYTIAHYSDLDEALGSKWFIRGLNERGDFCYAILDTVRFYLRKRLPLNDYIPGEDGAVKK